MADKHFIESQDGETQLFDWGTLKWMATPVANQEVWISHWGGEFYPGRGVPGESETPPSG